MNVETYSNLLTIIQFITLSFLFCITDFYIFSVEITSIFGGVFDSNEDDEIKIVPHVVLSVDMFVKGNSFVVKSIALETANEARVVQNLFSLLLLT